MTEQRAQKTQQLIDVIRNSKGIDEKLMTFIMNALRYSHHIIIEVSLTLCASVYSTIVHWRSVNS
jgi:hypothetical protein